MSCAAGGGRPTSAEEEADPAQVAIGERLFLETRFSQYFFAHAGGDANAVLAVGDPVMNALDTLAGPIPDPFAGGGINCRNCHLVDDAKDTPGGGNRSYADFTRHSPIPAREDGLTLTPRNSPALVNASLARGRTFVLSEPFRTPASADAPGRTDLGAWNIVRNPDFGDRRLQRGLTRMVCNAQAQPAACRRSPAATIDAAGGMFKTPGLRTLGQSGPYLHTGNKDTLEDVVRLYVKQSALARAGALRNGAHQLRDVHISESDVAPLAAFLRSLNEDCQ